VSQPLYFLPGVNAAQLAPDGKLSRSLLESRGIGDVFADVVAANKDCSICDMHGLGPGERSGSILCYQTPGGDLPKRLGYYPDEQTWHQISEGLWIGTMNDSPPTESDLRRKKQHGGYSIELANGERFNIPVIRRPDGSTELPTDMYWDANGAIVEPIKAAYRKYWDETEVVAEWFFAKEQFGGESFNKGKALLLAVDAVGINYRFGKNEQNVLRFIDKENYLSVLMSTIDGPLAVELGEKKSADAEARDAMNTSPGSTEGLTITDQAG
jgi:hypothetical protein